VLTVLNHADCMALLACIDDSVTLEVYPTHTGNAYGQLYIDDGWSFEYQLGGSALILIDYKDNILETHFNYGSEFPMP